MKYNIAYLVLNLIANHQSTPKPEYIPYETIPFIFVKYDKCIRFCYQAHIDGDLHIVDCGRACLGVIPNHKYQERKK